ncbi:MAG: hypothetical protein HY319_23740 [Armatimonadetes bacterium]|nr:hypothetical protein [Armatimonadota bacterium]
MDLRRVRKDGLGGPAVRRTTPPPGLSCEPGESTPAPVPTDRSEVAPSPPQKPKKSLIRRLFKLTGYGAMTAAGGMSLLGGLGYYANREVLSKPLAVEVYSQSELFQAPPASLPESRPTPAPAASRSVVQPSLEEGVTVIVPGDTLRSFAGDLQQTPGARRFMEEKIATTRQNLSHKLQQVKIPDQEVLLDLEMPFPVGERALIRLGDVDLPSFGMKSLEAARLPVVLETRTDPIEPNLQFELGPVEVARPAPPPGLQEGALFLGACRARFQLPEEGVALSGEVRLKLDLDGEATQKKLSRLEPGSERTRQLGQKLERRIEEGRRIQAAVQEQGLQGLLQDAFLDQRADFQARVRGPQKPLAEVVYHLWLAPDPSGDGRADVVVAQQPELDHVSSLELDVTRLEVQGNDPEGRLGLFLNQTVEGYFRAGIQSAVPQVTEVLRKLATRRIASEFDKGVALVEGTANQKLQSLFRQGERIDLNTGSRLAPELLLSLGRVEPDGRGNVAVGFHASSQPGGRLNAELPPGMQLSPGQFAVRISGGELSRQLQDRSQGGAVDWEGILQHARDAAGLRELRFGREPDGRTVYPRLIFADGRPAVEFDLVAGLKGASPVKGVTGLAKGATGLLDGGAEKLQGTLSKHAGPVGGVLGGILRAPTFLVDKVVHGGKFVVDNTVGAVVDPLPEIATRPTVQTRVTIPLSMSVENGGLVVSPDGDHVRFSSPEEKLPFNPLDLLPTRLLSNLIVNLVAQIDGPEKVGQQVQDRSVGLHLGNYGVEFQQLVPMDSPGAPDVVLKLGVRPRAADRVAEHFLPQRPAS